MKKGAIIGIVIGILTVFGIIMLCIENARWDEFKSAFGFYPSGTNYGLFAGDPDPRLKDREQDLIWKTWEQEYVEIEKLYQKTKETKGSDYAENRELFQRSLKNFQSKINLAHHFGYWIDPDDPEGFLKN